ncbi:MAG: response regulator receiver protein [Desulfobacterales bacterium]|nr:MAG: response regulator receiver protein [Desulfobacterales bacterium]
MSVRKAQIEGFSLENILQIFSMEKKSRTLLVRSGTYDGVLDIHEGNLINAQLNDLQGIDAAKAILSWDRVKVEMIKLRGCHQTITMPTIALLFEAAKEKDEKKGSHGTERLKLLRDAAIQRVALRFYDQGFKQLSQYLKKNKYDVEAWIWFSRVSGKLEVIQKALRTAGRIDAKHPLFIEESQKLSVSMPLLRGEPLSKCLFCWTPMNKTDHQCPYCLGYQNVSLVSLNAAGSAKKDILDRTQRRYETLLTQHPDNVFLCYALALIQVNKGLFSEGLAYFDKITRLSPDKAIFTKQLELLLDYLAKSSGQTTQPEAPLMAPDIEALNPNIDEKEPSKSKKILVVEDSSTTRKVIAISLKRNEYEVVEAADGLEALSKVNEERPDLILLDVMLPKMDGYEVLSILRNNLEFKSIPVIMLTSKDGFINKMKGKIAGSAAYLTKPFDLEKMIHEIEKHI